MLMTERAVRFGVRSADSDVLFFSFIDIDKCEIKTELGRNMTFRSCLFRPSQLTLTTTIILATVSLDRILGERINQQTSTTCLYNFNIRYDVWKWMLRFKTITIFSSVRCSGPKLLLQSAKNYLKMMMISVNLLSN